MAPKPLDIIESPKRKKVNVTPIERKGHGPGAGSQYVILDRLITAEREDLVGVEIRLAYRKRWTVDKDGHLKVGKCCKPNEVGRQFMDCDIVILLNEELWPLLKPKQKEELVFHEIEHIVVVLDTDANPKRDEKGRIVVRIRHHDLEEFESVRRKYGKDNLRSIGPAILARAKEPLLPDEEAG